MQSWKHVSITAVFVLSGCLQSNLSPTQNSVQTSSPTLVPTIIETLTPTAVETPSPTIEVTETLVFVDEDDFNVKPESRIEISEKVGRARALITGSIGAADFLEPSIHSLSISKSVAAEYLAKTVYKVWAVNNRGKTYDDYLQLNF